LNHLLKLIYSNKEFFPFLKNKIIKNISNNYDLMPFTDNNESMAPSNQTLINYGITILSIEKFFISILKNPLTQRELNKSTLENIEFFLQQFNVLISDIKNIKNVSKIFFSSNNLNQIIKSENGITFL